MSIIDDRCFKPASIASIMNHGRRCGKSATCCCYATFI